MVEINPSCCFFGVSEVLLILFLSVTTNLLAWRVADKTRGALTRSAARCESRPSRPGNIQTPSLASPPPRSLEREPGKGRSGFVLALSRASPQRCVLFMRRNAHDPAARLAVAAAPPPLSAGLIKQFGRQPPVTGTPSQSLHPSFWLGGDQIPLLTLALSAITTRGARVTASCHRDGRGPTALWEMRSGSQKKKFKNVLLLYN